MRAETYEERADKAEYEVERLTGMIIRFLRTYKDDQEGSVAELRKEWQKFVKQSEEEND